jgi:tetratricopeptide (TPR) repeat protein
MMLIQPSSLSWTLRRVAVLVLVFSGCSPSSTSNDHANTPAPTGDFATPTGKSSAGSASSMEPSHSDGQADSTPSSDGLKASGTATNPPVRDSVVAGGDIAEGFDAKLAQTEMLLQTNQIEPAWSLAKDLIVERPQSAPALFLAARIMAKRGNLKGAMQLIAKIDWNDPQAGPAATGQWAEWLAQSGDLSAAEQKLKGLLKSYPAAVPALKLLVEVYHAQGRRWEASRYLDRLIRLGNFSTPDLMHSIDFREPVDPEALRTAAMTFAPTEPYSQLGGLRILANADRWRDALGPLRQLVQSRPDLLEPWIWYGEALLETQAWTDLATWNAQRPEGYANHPEYWYVIGRWLQHQRESASAARALCESLRLDRRHVASMQALSECLMEMNEPDLAIDVRQEAGKLVKIKDLSQQIQRGLGKREEFLAIADLYRELNDSVAAFGWDAVLLVDEQKPITPELMERQKKLRAGEKSENRLLTRLPIDRWPMPDTSNATTIPAIEPRPITEVGAMPIVLRDVADGLGLTARYENGAAEGRGWTTHEGLGGGVSAIDYDRDGWPDLFYSQAGDVPTSATPQYLPKQLYRSIGGKRFVESASASQMADLGYGQGTGVADIDQDGFQDLLVAELGAIKCFRNQGDGTFEQTPILQAPATSYWNSAIQAADINGDGLPDVIQCNYIDGTDFLTRVCQSSADSKLLFCHPKRFEPGRSRVLMNQGDGGWLLADDPWQPSLVDGYALGALITNLDQQHGNDVFFANDVSPNHLLLSQSMPAGTAELVESAMRSGVAVDALGRAQACMGVACGDQNRDGLLDLIVTNFRFEVSTLYLQVSPGVFRDGTRISRLGESTLEWLSFGCQLTDLDNDGWLDFIAVNGHIDFLDPWQMPPQVLHNRKGQFEWLRKPSPGAYFDVDNVGRSLTMLDYNRDGRMDFAITHLDRPTALLANESPIGNHFVQLELVGTRSERDATGAMVHVQSGDERWVAPMSVGDGFYGTNERVVHVGMGTADRIDAMEIVWPTGERERFDTLAVDARYRCIEGIGLFPVELPGGQ